ILDEQPGKRSDLLREAVIFYLENIHNNKVIAIQNMIDSKKEELEDLELKITESKGKVKSIQKKKFKRILEPEHEKVDAWARFNTINLGFEESSAGEGFKLKHDELFKELGDILGVPGTVLRQYKEKFREDDKLAFLCDSWFTAKELLGWDKEYGI
ncbi:MAG: hypothetical protein LBU40_04985, partial [Methanobrevibacter sp.]|nr:hypothetical protein [Methanobrevibacter sp.]